MAGVPNRVYYRVRTPLGETVAPDGPVSLFGDGKLIYRSPAEEEAG